MWSVQVLQAERSCEQQGITANEDAHRVLELNDFSVSEKWHRPYAEALQETDSTELPTLIAEAENAIFDRYLELCTSRGSMEQTFDLQRAISVLAQLKKTRVIEHNSKNSVS
jgi:hypothetical protein